MRFIGAARLRELRRADDFGVVVAVERLRLVHQLVLPAAVVAAVVAVAVAHSAAAATATAAVARALVGPITALISEVASHRLCIQKGRQLGFGHRADLLGLDRAVLEQDQRRDPADAELGRRLGVLVDVELGDLDACRCTRWRSHRGWGRSSCRGRTTRPRNRGERACRISERPGRTWHRWYARCAGYSRG